ncbi:hypothetical protein [Ottowia sp.]|uniref:hypothetical protein n=1 Tax=Ottowia sp. TaxID=1898956 RepID=UPI003A89CB92
MTIPDERTSAHQLPLPNSARPLHQDVQRLRAALRLIDQALAARGASATTLQQALDQHLSATGAHTKAQVGLGAVDNTADADKPISTATAAALASKQAKLASGTTIKTVGGQSLLGDGDISLIGSPTTAASDADQSQYTWHANGTLQKKTFVLNGQAGVVAYSYTANGLPSQSVTDWMGVRVTTIYTWSGSDLIDTTTTKEPL